MSRIITRKETLTNSNFVTDAYSSVIDTARTKIVGIQSVIDVNTPSAKTFVDADVAPSTDIITITAHGFTTTGLKAALTTDGVLPAGLSATNYYVIVVSADTIKLATSLANAQAGTAVNITAAAGGGTHTLTPASLADATIGLQKSNDYDPYTGSGNWSEEVSASFTADGSAWIKHVDPEYQYCRVHFYMSAGMASAVSTLVLKQDL